MTPSPSPPSALLSICRRILNQAGFRVEERHLVAAEDAQWLVAESEYFILGVVTGETLDDLLNLEGYAAADLGALVTEADLGPKRWDSYLILLATGGADQRGRPEVVRLEHNTRSLRRIVGLGTAPHEEAVLGALATFLPLPPPPPGGLPSALEELIDQLVLNGVPKEDAAVAVAGYRSRVGIDGD